MIILKHPTIIKILKITKAKFKFYEGETYILLILYLRTIRLKL